MIAAEKWYEYQRNYKKYGFDMKPKSEPVRKEKPKAKYNIGVRDKLHMLELLMLAGVLCVGLVISSAYCAKIQFTTNELKAEYDALKSEVQSLDVAVKCAAGVETVENRAISELGMVYPSAMDIAYVDCSQQADAKTTATMKEDAYPVN